MFDIIGLKLGEEEYMISGMNKGSGQSQYTFGGLGSLFVWDIFHFSCRFNLEFSLKVSCHVNYTAEQNNGF